MRHLIPRMPNVGSSKLAAVLILLFQVSVVGCAHLHDAKPFSFPSPNVSVVDNVIYCDDKPFAELKKYVDKDFWPEDQRAQGLILRYLRNGQEVWIHPKEGLSIVKDSVRYTRIDDLNNIWNDTESSQRWRLIPYIGSREMRKEDAIRSIVYDVRISPDGKYIFFKSQGMILDSSHRFSVEAGH